MKMMVKKKVSEIEGKLHIMENNNKKRNVKSTR